MNTRPVKQADIDKFFARQRARAEKRKQAEAAAVVIREPDISPPVKKQTLKREDDFDPSRPCINDFLSPDLIKVILIQMPTSCAAATYLVCSYWTNILRASKIAPPGFDASAHAAVREQLNDLALLYFEWKSPSPNVLATAAEFDNQVIQDWLIENKAFTEEDMGAALFCAASNGHSYPFRCIPYFGELREIVKRAAQKDHAHIVDLLHSQRKNYEIIEWALYAAYKFGTLSVILYAIYRGALGLVMAMRRAVQSKHPALITALYRENLLSHDDLMYAISTGVEWTVAHELRDNLIVLLDIAREIDYQRDWVRALTGIVQDRFIRTALCLLTDDTENCQCSHCIIRRHEESS